MSTTYAIRDKELGLLKQNHENMLCLFSELKDAEKYHKRLVMADKFKTEVVKINMDMELIKS